MREGADPRVAPLPADYDAAVKEVLALRRILRKEREVLAKNVGRRAAEARANRGNIRALREENAKLRQEAWNGRA